MLLGQIKERLIETSSLARRIYGLKLLLLSGLSDDAKWFLFNKENLKYRIKLSNDGLVLDIGGYMGEFTSKLSRLNPNMTFIIYEPVPIFYDGCLTRFKMKNNISVLPYGVTSNGRNIDLAIDGPRTKSDDVGDDPIFPSKSMIDILNNLDQVELLKMNIEGLEYECLYSIIVSGHIKKINYLLIQFHNFKVEDESDYVKITELISEDFVNIFRFKWKWELWQIKI